MPRRVKKLLQGTKLTSIEALIAEDPVQMAWLSQLYTDPKVRIVKEEKKSMATHLLILIRYTYPSNYKDELDRKHVTLIRESNGLETETTREDTFGLRGGSLTRKKELKDGKFKAIGYTDSR